MTECIMRFTAKEIDAVQFRYEYEKDGKPRTNPKRVMHAHGSNEEMHERSKSASSAASVAAASASESALASESSSESAWAVEQS